MKKLAICGWSTGDNSWGVTKAYLEYFSQFGQVEILTPSEGIRADIDMVVLPGGLDTPSSNYGAKPSFMNSNSDVYKEYFVKQNLQQYIDAGKSVFGICLGAQQLNVHFGGKLTQHIWWNHGYSSPRTELVHEVHPMVGQHNDGQWIFSKVKKDIFKVNSMHHQGIDLEQLASELIPLLVDEDEILVEAFRHRTLPIAGYQGHPEETYCKFATQLINELLNRE